MLTFRFAGDEPGDGSFNFTKGASRYFVVAVIGTQNPDALRDLLADIRQKAYLQYDCWQDEEIGGVCRLKTKLPRYPDPSRADGGRRPQMATFREAGKSYAFYTDVIVTFGDAVKYAIKRA